MQPRWLRRLTSAQRKALVVTLISCLGWSLWNGFRKYEHPWGDLSKGKFSDHFSHMNAARVFPRMGLDIWRVPISHKFRQLHWDELYTLPEDVRAGGSLTGGVFYVPGWPKDKPLTIGWSQKTRMYPPGDMLLVAPIAAIYHYTSLSLSGACRMLIGWFIILAHVALFFFFLNYFESEGSGLDWLVGFLVYSHVMYWTLEGFYDAVAIVPVVVSARYLHRRRGIAAGLAFSIGTILHFRTFFHAPYALWALGQAFRDRFWQRLRVRHLVAIMLALICVCISIFVFWLDWESLKNVIINNPLRTNMSPHDKAMIWNFKVVLGLCVLTFLWSRSWIDIAQIAWLSYILFTLREFYYWHLLISLGWVAAPAPRQIVRAARLAFVVTVVAIIFRDPFAPEWLWMLHEKL
jgi:hypothetical protein